MDSAGWVAGLEVGLCGMVRNEGVVLVVVLVVLVVVLRVFVGW